MTRKWLRRYMPSHQRVREQRWLRHFGETLYHPSLWHVNRKSASRAFAIGLFWSMIPMPLQMVASTACAIRLRANVGLALALVWLSNPLTIPPIYYGCYQLGRWVLGMEAGPSLGVEWSRCWHWSMWSEVGRWMTANLAHVWKPLYVGSVIGAVVLSVRGYLLVRGLWRLQVARRWRQRSPARAHAGARRPLTSRLCAGEICGSECSGNQGPSSKGETHGASSHAVHRAMGGSEVRGHLRESQVVRL